MECTWLSEDEILWLDRLNRIGIGYFRPLVAVSLLPELNICPSERVAFYAAIERFIFIAFRMAMYQSSYKSSEYYRNTRLLYKKTISINSLTESLNETIDGIAGDAIKVFITKMNHRFLANDGLWDGELQ